MCGPKKEHYLVHVFMTHSHLRAMLAHESDYCATVYHMICLELEQLDYILLSNG